MSLAKTRISTKGSVGSQVVYQKKCSYCQEITSLYSDDSMTYVVGSQGSVIALWMGGMAHSHTPVNQSDPSQSQVSVSLSMWKRVDSVFHRVC